MSDKLCTPNFRIVLRPDVNAIASYLSEQKDVAEAYPGGIKAYSEDNSTKIMAPNEGKKDVVVTYAEVTRGFEAEAVIAVNCFNNPDTNLSCSRATTMLVHVAYVLNLDSWGHSWTTMDPSAVQEVYWQYSKDTFPVRLRRQEYAELREALKGLDYDYTMGGGMEKYPSLLRHPSYIRLKKDILAKHGVTWSKEED